MRCPKCNEIMVNFLDDTHLQCSKCGHVWENIEFVKDPDAIAGLKKKYAYLDIKEGDYVQTKEIVKGKVKRIIPTENTDQWGMALPDAEMGIERDQKIVVALRDLEKQNQPNPVEEGGIDLAARITLLAEVKSQRAEIAFLKNALKTLIEKR